MDALKIRVSGIVSSLHQRLIAGLHQRAYAAAQHRLLAEQVRLRLGAERGLQNAGSRAADGQRIRQGHIQRLAGGILLHRYQAGNALAFQILGTHRMAGALGSDHGHVHILRRFDASEMNVESMGEHQHIALFQVGLDIFLVHIRLQLIVDQNHDDIRLFGRFRRGIHFKSGCFRLGPGQALGVFASHLLGLGLCLFRIGIDRLHLFLARGEHLLHRLEQELFDDQKGDQRVTDRNDDIPPVDINKGLKYFRHCFTSFPNGSFLRLCSRTRTF